MMAALPMNADPVFLRWPRTLVVLTALFFAVTVSQASDTPVRVEVVKIPGASNVMMAQRGADGAIHVIFGGAEGLRYVKSTDGGKNFSAPIDVVDQAARTRIAGLEFTVWDLAVAADGRVHVAIGNNAWKLKLPEEDRGFYYTSLAPGAKEFTPLRNINNKPSEGFSLATSADGQVTANFISGKIYTMASRDGGQSFSPFAELNPALDPCTCCSTSTTYGADGRMAMLYREKTNNERDIYLSLIDRNGGAPKRTRISGTPWKLEGCPMTYFTVRPTATGYVAAWPTKGDVYFSRLDKEGNVLPPGEIKTPGTNGMRTGIVALPAQDGATLIVWKNEEVLGWQLYDAQGAASGGAGSQPSPGKGAAAVALPDGRFMVFP